MFSFSSFSSVLIKLTHLDKFPLHRNVVSGKLGSGQLAFIIIEMLIGRAFFPSSPGPLYQNEVKCSAFDMKMIFHSHANKTHFHKKGCAPSLILKVRVFGTRKWPTRHSTRNSRGLGTSFQGNDFWDGLGRQALAVIGQWYPKATSSQLCLGCPPKRSQKLLP